MRHWTLLSRADRGGVILSGAWTTSTCYKPREIERDWFTDINVRVDLGYLGIQSDYKGDQIDIPSKKPRKSKKNPNPQLNDDQKAANKALSQVRIFIEHAIGGMKRYNILVHVFRNRKAGFEDDAVGICAGLWNLALSY